jgi:hypothetical protein
MGWTNEPNGGGPWVKDRSGTPCTDARENRKTNHLFSDILTLKKRTWVATAIHNPFSDQDIQSEPPSDTQATEPRTLSPAKAPSHRRCSLSPKEPHLGRLPVESAGSASPGGAPHGRAGRHTPHSGQSLACRQNRIARSRSNRCRLSCRRHVDGRSLKTRGSTCASAMPFNH